MQELNKPLYIEVSSVHELNQKITEGYRLVTVVYRDYVNSNSDYASLNGTFMGNSINLSGNMGNSNFVQKQTYYLMKLKPTENLLYGQT